MTRLLTPNNDGTSNVDVNQPIDNTVKKQFVFDGLQILPDLNDYDNEEYNKIYNNDIVPVIKRVKSELLSSVTPFGGGRRRRTSKRGKKGIKRSGKKGIKKGIKRSGKKSRRRR